MAHLPDLIQDLAFILMTAAAVTLLCRFLKQPVVLGYLIAGFLVGPHFPFLHTISDTKGVQVWAEIGVVFLLFALGLEFSFKKLAKVGGSASTVAIVEVMAMLGIGYFSGQLIGWSHMDSLFLGGILSISSTTIIVRAFEELGFKGKKFVSLVFGVLIVEDLVAILLLVLLSSVGASSKLEGGELIGVSVKLGFFLVLWFMVGVYVLPSLLKALKKFMTDETLLMVSLGLCLMMVMVATKVGFSPALGAFVMGSLLAETGEGHRIEKLLLPVRDLFAAVFFVSVGMLIDPNVIQEHFWTVALLTLLTIIGKFLSSAIGALLSGQSLKTSIQSGMSLAQIGEFSFIIATLGFSLGVTSDFLYPIAVAVSAITTFTTPYQIKYSSRFYDWVDAQLPSTFKDRLARYEGAVSRTSGRTIVRLVWEQYGMKILLNAIMVIAVSLLTAKILLPWFFPDGEYSEGPWLAAGLCLFTLLVSTPFLWGVTVGAPVKLSQQEFEVVGQLRRLQFGISAVRIIVGLALVGFVVGQFAPVHTASGLMLVVLAILIVFFGKFSEPLYNMIETRFVANLNEKDRAEITESVKRPELAPWQAALTEFTLSPYSTLVGRPLHQSLLKENFGLTLALIERGTNRIFAPGRDVLLMPYDRLFLIGEDEQLEKAKEVIQVQRIEETETLDIFGLDSYVVTSSSQFAHKSIRESGIRDHAQGLIVGLERDGARILSPDSGLLLLPGDLIWIVGDKIKMSELKKAT